MAIFLCRETEKAAFFCARYFGGAGRPERSETLKQRFTKLLFYFGLFDGDRTNTDAGLLLRLLAVACFVLGQNIWLIYYSHPVFSNVALALMALGGLTFVTMEFARFFRLRPVLRFAKWPLLLWLAFAAVALLSDLSHGIICNSLVYLLVIPGLIVLLHNDRNTIYVLLSGTILGHLPMLLWGLVRFPLVNNSFSLELACACALFFVPLWNVLRAPRLHWGRLLLCTLLLLSCIVLSWFSGGRTGFLTITGLFMLFFFLVVIRYRGMPPCLRQYKIFYIVSAFSLVLLLLVTFALGGFIYKYFHDSKELMVKPGIIPPVKHNNFTYTDTDILEKMNYVIQISDPLSGREIVWGKVLENPTWLGNPPDFFQTLGLPVYRQTAHNSFLAVFAQLGIPAMALYLLAYGCICYLAIQFYRRRKDSPLALFPLFVIASYTMAGIFEDLSYIVSTRVHAILFYAVAAYLIMEAASRRRYIVLRLLPARTQKKEASK